MLSAGLAATALISSALAGFATPQEPSAADTDAGPQSGGEDSSMQGMVQAMPGRGHNGETGMSMGEPATSLVEEIEQHAASGTSAEPDSTPHPMLMTMRDGWMLMLHGVAFLSDIQQSGPRGRDRLFSTNWIMPMAQRRLGPGTLTLRAMLSLEPATITGREYPELFQQGETAFGRPIADGQHPHDFFMELAALYDMKLGEGGLLSFYAAPVGDPAMGPTAYPHRASASEDPIAALGHHLEDSTHIASDVVTVGLAYRSVRLEASGFHGREPDEYRWDIDTGRIDSWSSRITVNPARNWSGQYSIARLKSPEQLNPAEDVLRMTASVMYNRPLASGNWASTLLWGRNRTLPGGEVFNGYLAESTLRFRSRNSVWSRVENVDRTNELLLGGNPEPAGFQEHFLARIQAYTAGYDHDFDLVPHLRTALGAQVTLYGTPASLDPVYGAHPLGVVLFLRVRPVGRH
ncbi:MAG TPA: hypothetical protein VKU44_09755 [Terriglobia bacterium]|nr:hypothetical protein [Terriglobia bacterium]